MACQTASPKSSTVVIPNITFHVATSQPSRANLRSNDTRFSHRIAVGLADQQRSAGIPRHDRGSSHHQGPASGPNRAFRPHTPARAWPEPRTVRRHQRGTIKRVRRRPRHSHSLHRQTRPDQDLTSAFQPRPPKWWPWVSVRSLSRHGTARSRWPACARAH